MSKIRVMSPILANKIAAGEVVERVSSVVKELVENSIDAKSKMIKIELLEGGKKAIRVIDDGIGMDKSDAEKAFLRHATSKIYKDDDLFFINTLGFRGEALPSIASVAEVILETYDGSISTLVHIKGGEILEVTPADARKGTTITVTNLFYNTPARLKYLKSEPAELSMVSQFVEKLSLSYPEISFILTNDKTVVLKTSGSGDLKKVIYEIYGANVSSNMLEVRGSNDDYDIWGYISKPILQRSTKNFINTIINGRVIKNFELNKIINDAYHTYKPDSVYPIVVLKIETDPTLIDVNIHPTKQDIKFSKMAELKSLITDTIKDVLYKNLLVPDALYAKKEKETEDKIEMQLPKALFIKEEGDESPYGSFEDKKLDVISRDRENIEKEKIVEKSSTQLDADFAPIKNEEMKGLELYPVGIALGTYIIAENKEGVYLIDQHAAVERVNYEEVLKGLQVKSTHLMLIPITMEFSPSEMKGLEDKRSILEDLGFVYEEFGINTLRITGHPTWVKEGHEGETIRSIFDILLETKEFDPLKFNDKVAATIACKKSLKGNTRITLEMAKNILEKLVLCDNPYNCPHGRPTIIKFTIYELEKMFKRAM